MIAILAGRVRRLMEAHPEATFEAIGVSLPGRVDRFTQKLVFAPNLGWRDVDFKTPLEQATGLPVLVENAANACALSEVWSGPFAGVQDLIAVTVTEGIGTGIIANGHLVRGPTGAAGEFGHVCLDPDGPPCRCGSKGCWEAYASNAAAIQAYNQGMQADPESPIRRRKRQAFASVRDFRDLLSLADRGDVAAGEVLDRMGRYLGLGLTMLVKGLAPSVVTIVGEVTRAWNRVGPIVKKVVERCAGNHAATRIVPTDDHLQPRLRGTVALVLQKHFQPYMLS
jgi:predicted NBD/HSP70 family sugar kinase